MRERQEIKRKAISVNAVAKAAPDSVLICVVLTTGALFGMAAQTALDHYGLNLASVRDDLILDRIAQSRSALAWWAWWFVPVAAFFVGPLSTAATRCLIANWWLLRGLRLCVSAALVLGLAMIGHLRAAPSTFDISAGAAVGGLVALGSAMLAALGARSIPIGRRRRTGLDERRRDFDPVPPPPWRGGGSVESGLAVRQFGFRKFGRAALAGVAGLVVLGAVSALSGGVVVLELLTPGAIRQVRAGTVPPDAGRSAHIVAAPGKQGPDMQARETQTRAMAFAPLPASEIAGAHIAIVPTIPEGELTFAKGYAKRRAAQEADQRAAREAADIVMAALQFQIKVPDKLRRRAVTLQRAEHDGRPRRHVTIVRHDRERNHADRRYAQARDPRGAHWPFGAYDSPGSRYRHTADTRHGRHGNQDRYARSDHSWFAGF